MRKKLTEDEIWIKYNEIRGAHSECDQFQAVTYLIENLHYEHLKPIQENLENTIIEKLKIIDPENIIYPLPINISAYAVFLWSKTILFHFTFPLNEIIDKDINNPNLVDELYKRKSLMYDFDPKYLKILCENFINKREIINELLELTNELLDCITTIKEIDPLSERVYTNYEIN